MKTRVLALAAIGAILGGSAALGQSASVSSTATVVVPISATATAPLAFGTVTRGNTTTVAATAAAAGSVTFSGDEADQITISVPTSATISTTSGAGANMTVTIARSTLRSNTSNTQGTAAVLDASSGSATASLSTDAGGNAVNNDGLGQLYLWIGGSVTAAAAQQRGSYAGTFTVSAVYAN